MERRTFIIGAVAGGIGLLEYAFVSRYMNSLRAPRGASVKAYKRLGEQAALVAITPNDDFYVTSKGTTPYLDASQWRLKVDGLVANSFTLTYDELLKLPRIEKTLTTRFGSAPSMAEARWRIGNRAAFSLMAPPGSKR